MTAEIGTGNANYILYRRNGGTETEDAYNQRLAEKTGEIADLIINDPTDTRSDIGKRIFNHLGDDISSAIAFVRAHPGLYRRAGESWFAFRAPAIVLKYIQRGTSYKDFLRDQGWREILTTAGEIAGLGLTTFGAIESGIHASHVPSDAPHKVVEVTDSHGGKHKIEVIDHPEAYLANRFAALSVISGTLTAVGSVTPRLIKYLGEMDLVTFFDPDLIDNAANVNLGQKLATPGFRKWKLEQISKNLLSNPVNWQQDRLLRWEVCPLSDDFRLFPVRDGCGHYFDYRSLRRYQLVSTTADPFECPVSETKPNRGLASLRFDKDKFDEIQVAIIRTQAAQGSASGASDAEESGGEVAAASDFND